MKDCLVVLGMHRSGTSAFTGILDILGVHLGARMLETQADNPKGFFENKYVVQVNDCILDALESSWDDCFALPPDWRERFAESRLERDMLAFLRTDLHADRLSAIKDPRMSRLLPLWLPHFAAAEVRPHFALVIRNPLEIAGSLQRRNQFSTEKSLILWMQYMLDAEYYSREYPRGFINYDTLLTDPETSVARLFTSAGLALPRDTADHSGQLAEFLDRELRHHEITEQELAARCPPLFLQYYRLLCQIAAAGGASAADIAAIDDIRRSFDSELALYYNADVSALRASARDLHPRDADDALRQQREQFERDKINREYRYISNTEHIYRERAQFFHEREESYRERKDIQAYAHHLEEVISQFTASPPWRVHRKYQEMVEQWLPTGSLRRRLLQRAKLTLGALARGHGRDDIAGSADTPAEAAAADTPTTVQLPPEAPAMHFPEVAQPLVSIIIPVFNNWRFTHKCLHSVLERTRGSYEVIVVDNHSTDETPQQLAAIPGLTVITNDSNEVFVNACNQAASAARGRYLLLLNNDTEVTAGWLEAMLAPFTEDTTGVVGAKLVYPDGRLQEAGGIIWRDATGCNYGHGDDPGLPRYNYRKAVDYCSGACLLIPAALWREIGGFDVRYAPAYYEDTDLCFTVRSLGYRVIYQPRATVIHYGGASAGKETSAGYKRFQDINRHKFVEKWQDVLAAGHVPSSAGLLRSRERRGDRHILVIDHHLPTFDRDSGSQRMYCMLQILIDMGYKVSFWPDDMRLDARYTTLLQDIGVETYYGDMAFEDLLREMGEDLDVVLMSRPATALKYLQTVKKYSSAQTIFDTVDLHFLREQRRLELEVQHWKTLEFFLAQESDNTLVVSPAEQALLAQESFADRIAVVSNIHSLEPCATPFAERQGLLFIGGFAHPPNEEGVHWFIEFILPLVRRRIPDVHFTVIGSDPTERLLAAASPNVTITGYVEDVAPYFHSARVFVSPLRHGAGVKGKIGQSFSYGLPVVTTSIGAEGMHLTDGHNALISDTETGFAERIIELYRDEFLWQKLSANSRDVIREQFSPTTIRAALETVLRPRASRDTASQPRPVIVHCHLFKNAGTTLDWSLQRQFGSAFIDHRDDEAMRRGASFLEPYLRRHPEVSALSSHHVRFPLPAADDLRLLPIIGLRHPIERARSVYEFERRQQASTPGAIKAKELAFADYIRWRLRPDVSPTIRNFHCCFCIGEFDREILEQDCLDSIALLTRTRLLFLVERYDESMVWLERELARDFGAIDLAYIVQNVTPGREGTVQQRIDSIDAELGPELSREFRERNHWDMKLYEAACAIVIERLGSVGRLDTLLENFRARCRVLGAQQH